MKKTPGKGNKKAPPGIISPPRRTESIFAMEDPDRLLYGDAGGGEGRGGGDGEDDEDDDEPVTCFYVEKRGVLRRGVGAAGGGAGVGRDTRTYVQTSIHAPRSLT